VAGKRRQGNNQGKDGWQGEAVRLQFKGVAFHEPLFYPASIGSDMNERDALVTYVNKEMLVKV